MGMKKAALWIAGEQKAGDGLAAAFVFTVLISVKLVSGNSNFKQKIVTSVNFQLKKNARFS